MPLWIIRSEAELFVIGMYHLRQIWVDTKKTADFFDNIFKVRGEECGHSLGRILFIPVIKVKYINNCKDFLF